MMKYIHIIIFLLTHDLTELIEYWEADILKDKDFKWRRVFSILKMKHNPSYILYQNRNFLFWFRLIHFMYAKGNKHQKLVAEHLQIKLIKNYGVEVEFGAKIEKGFSIGHFSGIIISSNAIIGDNCHIMQNVTIGMKTIMAFNGDIDLPNRKIIIGNNVKIGAHSLILGDYLVIGNNVKIGAMSFVNKNISDNCTFYTKRVTKLI